MLKSKFLFLVCFLWAAVPTFVSAQGFGPCAFGAITTLDPENNENINNISFPIKAEGTVTNCDTQDIAAWMNVEVYIWNNFLGRWGLVTTFSSAETTLIGPTETAAISGIAPGTTMSFAPGQWKIKATLYAALSFENGQVLGMPVVLDEVENTFTAVEE